MFEQMLAKYEEVPASRQDQLISSVAVIGVDPVGQLIACSALAEGCRVNLHTSFGSQSQKLLDAESISVEGGRYAGDYKVTTGTTSTRDPAIRVVPELDLAIRGADVVVLTVPASAHATYAALLAPVLEPGQLVLLVSAGSFGALEVARALRTPRSRVDVALVEMSTAPYIVTQSSPGQLAVEAELQVVMAAVLSYSAMPNVVNSLLGLFPMLRAADSVLETSFGNMAGLLTAAPALLASSTRDRATLRDRLPSELLATVMTQLDRERVHVAAAYGVRGLPTLADWLEKTFGTIDRDVANALDEVSAFGRILCPMPDDPAVLDSVATCLVPVASAGHVAGVPTPVTSALITLAAAIHGTDHARNGRTLASLGFDRMRPDEVRRALDGANFGIAQELFA